MKKVNERTRAIFLIIIIVFMIITGFLWLDYIGVINISKVIDKYYKKEAPSVVDAADDEPSLIEREEFEKQKERLLERIEGLDRREANISQIEKEIEKEKEMLDEMRAGIELEKNKLKEEKERYSGYKRNVVDLARKISSMRPEEAKEIMIRWEDPLIIDVLRQMDTEAAEAGRGSITSYLISLMPPERASRIMHLMTQL